MGGIASAAHEYRRRRPEDTLLYRVLREELATFLQTARADSSRPGLPRFVERELRQFLGCGILARGFARVHCSACGKDGSSLSPRLLQLVDTGNR